MTHLVLVKDPLSDPISDHRSNRSASRSVGYRFGRISRKRTRAYAGRAVRGARGFFSAMLKIIAASKIRRIERELKFRGIRYDSVRLDGDHFVRSPDWKRGDPTCR